MCAEVMFIRPTAALIMLRCCCIWSG